MKIRSPVFLFLPFFIFSNCKTKNGHNNTPLIVKTQIDSTSAKDHSLNTADTRKWTIGMFYTKDSLLKIITDSIYLSLNNNERAAQMIMPATSEFPRIGLRFPEIMNLYSRGVIGGVLFLKGKESHFAAQIKLLNQKSVENKMLPLVFSCDCEPTLFHKKFIDQDSFPSANSILSPNQSAIIAKSISVNMVENGLNWNFAPVTDISKNKEIIDRRSFGENPEDIISKAVAFVKSSANENIATTLKHFPGHGAVNGDSHHDLVFIDSSLTELNNFKEVITKASPISIMIGHIAIKNNPTLSTNGMPSSLTKKIVTQLLKDSIGFKGIIVTDAMNMGAVKKIPDADILAVLAGNDVIVYPLNPIQLHKRIIRMLKSGGPESENIKTSIKKIIRLKICLGIIKLTGGEATIERGR